MRLSILVIALSLTACAGYDGTLTAEIDTTSDMNDSIPTVTNDGFYDGGVFDQDLLDMAPLRPRF